MALVAVPFGLAIAFAFSDVTSGDPSYDWVGLRNFERVFDDPVFWRSLWNTLIFTGISMFFIVLFGKILANILVADFRGKWVVRFLVLLPWTTPVALSSVSWLWLLALDLQPDRLGAVASSVFIETNIYWLGRRTLRWRRSSRSTCGGWCRSRR